MTTLYQPFVTITSSITENRVRVTPKDIPSLGTVMSIKHAGEKIVITKDQAMAFFGLVDRDSIDRIDNLEDRPSGK